MWWVICFFSSKIESLCCKDQYLIVGNQARGCKQPWWFDHQQWSFDLRSRCKKEGSTGRDQPLAEDARDSLCQSPAS